MRIELGNLKDGKGTFAHTYQPGELDLMDERVSLAAPVKVEVKLRLSAPELFVNGNVQTEVQVECDRCLKQLQLAVYSDFELEYITGNAYESTDDAELSEEVMSVSVFDGETLDTDEIAREQVLLAVPARTLCREDCKGICSNCGANLNLGQCDCKVEDIDPRWAALKNLADGKS